jgi:hypothetical protein
VNGETDLAHLLNSLAPELLPGNFRFVSIIGEPTPEVLALALASFREREGSSLVISADAVAQLPSNTACSDDFRCISLRVHSSLDAVGLTAFIARLLAEHDISANVIAAYHHDHVFVPAGRADEALKLLESVSTP